MGLFKKRGDGGDMLAADVTETRKDKENRAFEQVLKRLTVILRGFGAFSSEEELSNAIYESGLVFPKHDETYTYASEFNRNGHTLNFPSRKLVINNVPFFDGNKQVTCMFEFRKGLDELPCFIGVSKQRDQIVDPIESGE